MWLLAPAQGSSAVGQHLVLRLYIKLLFGLQFNGAHGRRLKDWRRVTTRYDRCPTVFFSAVALAAAVIFRL